MCRNWLFRDENHSKSMSGFCVCMMLYWKWSFTSNAGQGRWLLRKAKNMLIGVWSACHLRDETIWSRNTAVILETLYGKRNSDPSGRKSRSSKTKCDLLPQRASDLARLYVPLIPTRNEIVKELPVSAHGTCPTLRLKKRSDYTECFSEVWDTQCRSLP